MTRVLSRTAPILDEADRFERMLNWQLFAMEQDGRLFGYNEGVEWKPGDPLFQHPHLVQRNTCDCCHDEDEELSGYYGNHARPMVELLGDGDHYRLMKCSDCDVSWDSSESSCWMCGKEFPKPQFFGIRDFKWGNTRTSEPLFQVNNVRQDEYGLNLEMQVMAGLQAEIGEHWTGEHWTRIMNQHLMEFSIGMRVIGDVGRRAGESLRGFHDAFVFYDEVDMIQPYTWQSYSYNSGPIAEYRPPNDGYISNPLRDPFTQPDVVGPLWGTAALYDPHAMEGSYWASRLDLPETWGDVAFEARAIPLPQMPEPRDFSEEVDRAYWERCNPSYYRNRTNR